MVTEVRRQFREIKGILTREATPDYARCVEISTKGAQREMLLPSIVAIVVPILVGLILGPAGVMGLLIGGLGSGFVLAVFMSNSGGAWDNAKKYVEEGHLGGKNSEAHKATVTGDTVGDPFKDTSGPSLNILIKLMSMVAIVMAMLTVAIHSGVELPAVEEPAVVEEAAVVEKAAPVQDMQCADFNDAESEMEHQAQ
jgi:K(+)-stimulated pyrophosphate-energized sodium pump